MLVYATHLTGIAMIESLTISGRPQMADPLHYGPLRELNFVFGPNGSGKTTISRALAIGDAGVSIAWSDASNPETIRVYNRDYVEQTLANVGALPGVFLLGENSAEVADRISVLSADDNSNGSVRAAAARLAGLLTTKSNAESECADARKALTGAAWKAKLGFAAELREAWKRYNNDKANFIAEVLRVIAEDIDTTVEAPGLADLKESAKSVFRADAALQSKCAILEIKELSDFDHSDLLNVSIVGSTDATLAPLITALDNSDWVAEGRGHLAHANGVCPFCQQNAPATLADNLARYFDDAYTARTGELTTLRDSYVVAVAAVTSTLDAAARLSSDFLDPKAYKSARGTLDVALTANVDIVNAKVNSPSKQVTPIATGQALAQVVALLNGANEAVDEHNRLIAERETERPKLVAKCWEHFIRDTVAADLAAYHAAIVAPGKTIESVEGKIPDARQALADLEAELADLNSRARSNIAAIERINSTLQNVGFNTFRVAAAPSSEGAYVIERDGVLLEHNTLSEGERTFITFLYFYWSLHGSDSGTEDPRSTVAVIDDPISSLDSNILWVVCQLIRNLMLKVIDDASNLAQLVVLTHNAHFHREITYKRRNDDPLQNKRTFATIHKRPGVPGELTMKDANPVRSAYRTLWDEVIYARDNLSTNHVGLPNTMRRIIESYMDLLGGKNLDGLAEHFQGIELEIFQSFRAWANDGSHTVMLEELDHSPTGATTEMYLRVFEDVFRKSDQGGHYDMMMAGLN